MSATRTVGITTDRNGDYLSDKRHLGERICARLRQSTIDEASADVGRLLRLANLVLNRQETRTVLRVANG